MGVNTQEWMTIRFRTRSGSPGKTIWWLCGLMEVIDAIFWDQLFNRAAKGETL